MEEEDEEVGQKKIIIGMKSLSLSFIMPMTVILAEGGGGEEWGWGGGALGEEWRRKLVVISTGVPQRSARLRDR